jgi:uncharacterized protein YndB with AHSA1/START domain
MTNTPPAPAQILGSLRVEDGRGVVRLEDLYDTDIDDLWSALTRPDRLARWLAVVDGDARLGGVLRARFTSHWEGTIRVDVCEPPKRLLVTSWSDDTEETVMEAWLSAEGNGTRLIIEERGLPIEDVAAHGAGWQVHVEDLAALVAGNDISDWEARWRELTPAYQGLAKDLP